MRSKLHIRIRISIIAVMIVMIVSGCTINENTDVGMQSETASTEETNSNIEQPSSEEVPSVLKPVDLLEGKYPEISVRDAVREYDFTISNSNYQFDTSDFEEIGKVAEVLYLRIYHLKTDYTKEEVYNMILMLCGYKPSIEGYEEKFCDMIDYWSTLNEGKIIKVMESKEAEEPFYDGCPFDMMLDRSLSYIYAVDLPDIQMMLASITNEWYGSNITKEDAIKNYDYCMDRCFTVVDLTYGDNSNLEESKRLANKYFVLSWGRRAISECSDLEPFVNYKLKDFSDVNATLKKIQEEKAKCKDEIISNIKKGEGLRSLNELQYKGEPVLD